MSKSNCNCTKKCWGAVVLASVPITIATALIASGHAAVLIPIGMGFGISGIIVFGLWLLS